MGCKALFIGGIKSGKSKHAEEYVLHSSQAKPIYLATNEFFDEEMIKKVQHHKNKRANKFTTLEEPLKLVKIIKQQNSIVLVECVSMWINNMLYHDFNEEDILKEINDVAALETQTVFVINDVSCSVISDNKLTRNFVDINGRVAQLLALKCQDVYNTISGISVKIK